MLHRAARQKTSGLTKQAHLKDPDIAIPHALVCSVTYFYMCVCMPYYTYASTIAGMPSIVLLFSTNIFNIYSSIKKFECAEGTRTERTQVHEVQ